ncbi:hypothetical protein LOF13_00095 [Klebsiella pneumoniae subsp. pneumoniae]|nr:hypothetical protein LOF13_00095 [Klebsiella pneumoniae subsp. pneumoniae]
MFSYTGFSADQVDVLRQEHGIYLIASGRVCGRAQPRQYCAGSQRLRRGLRTLAGSTPAR